MVELCPSSSQAFVQITISPSPHALKIITEEPAELDQAISGSSSCGQPSNFSSLLSVPLSLSQKYIMPVRIVRFLPPGHGRERSALTVNRRNKFFMCGSCKKRVIPVSYSHRKRVWRVQFESALDTHWRNIGVVRPEFRRLACMSAVYAKTM